MLDWLRVWWVILTQVGPIGKSSRAAEWWMRFYVIKALEREGLFDYLLEPRNYGQIIAHFGFVDSPYTRDVLDTLSSEKHHTLIKERDRYRRNPRPSCRSITPEAPVNARSASVSRVSGPRWDHANETACTAL